MSGKTRISIPIYTAVLLVLLLAAIGASEAVNVFNETVEDSNRQVIIIDAGHGDPDGGATSCSGKLESDINLEISLRLDDLLHLMGFKTQLTRSTYESIYTQGNTIASKKISDMQNRVKIANGVSNGIVISIHQNYFQDGRYSGAQVFYSNTSKSQELATNLQDSFVKSLNPGSNRRPKRGEGIYLLNNVKCTAVLVECGFLSNLAEDAMLQESEYQKKICSVIASSISVFVNG